MIISLGAEKVFNKIQQSFIKKVLEISWIQGTYLNIIKAINSESTAKSNKWRETQSDSTKIRNKARLSYSPYLFHKFLKF